MRKRTIAIIGVAACVAAGSYGIHSLRSGRIADVQSVMSLNNGYYGDQTSLSGYVVDSSTQAVYAEPSVRISNTYVENGQQVHAGDPLLAYDLTSLQIAVEEARLQIQQTQIDINTAKANIAKYQNTQPIPDVIPTPEPEPEPEPQPTPEPTPEPIVIPDPVQAEDSSWNVITKFDQFVKEDGYEVPESNEDWKGRDKDGCRVKPADPEPQPEPEPTPEPDPQEEPVEDPEPGETPEPGEDPSPGEEPTPGEEPEPEHKPEDEDYHFYYGTYSHPFRYIIHVEDGIEGHVYGSLFEEIKEKFTEDKFPKGVFVQFEVYDGKYTEDQENLSAVWTVRTDRFQVENDTDCWNVLTHQKIDPSTNQVVVEEPEEPYVYVSSYDDDSYSSGYTKEELAQLIQYERNNLRTLEITQKRNRLKLTESEQALTDGIVYAKKDGVVTISEERSSTTPYLSVKSASGVEIQGTISERMLGQIKVGDIVFATDWESGTSFSAVISSIDNYPASSEYYGYGSDDSSMYGFHATTDEQVEINEGNWLELKIESADINYDMITLPNMYLNRDSGGTYVMKEVDGKLVKTYVTIGKSYYGYCTEVLSGVETSDYLAFPYGKKAVEGTKTKHPDDDYYYSDDNGVITDEIDDSYVETYEISDEEQSVETDTEETVEESEKVEE